VAWVEGVSFQRILALHLPDAPGVSLAQEYFYFNPLVYTFLNHTDNINVKTQTTQRQDPGSKVSVEAALLAASLS
jgi:hypothetical protein